MVNGARDAEEAGLVFRQLEVAATRFLGRELRYVRLHRAGPGWCARPCASQQPVVCRTPAAVAGQPCFRMLASRVAGLEAARRLRPAAARLARRRRRIGRFGGAAMRMTAAPPPVESDRNTPRDGPRRPGQGAGAAAGAAPAGAGRDDELISVGVLGLIDAAGRYKPALGVPFDAFARRRVQGAMLDCAARSRLGAALAAPHAPRRRLRPSRSLRHELEREPNEDEIAARDVDDRRPSTSSSLEQLRTLELGAIRSARRDHRGRHAAARAVRRSRGGRRCAARTHRAAAATSRNAIERAARARAPDPGALLRGRADAGRDRRGHRRRRVARLAAALAGAVPAAHARCATSLGSGSSRR